MFDVCLCLCAVCCVHFLPMPQWCKSTPPRPSAKFASETFFSSLACSRSGSCNASNSSKVPATIAEKVVFPSNRPLTLTHTPHHHHHPASKPSQSSRRTMIHRAAGRVAKDLAASVCDHVEVCVVGICKTIDYWAMMMWCCLYVFCLRSSYSTSLS